MAACAGSLHTQDCWARENYMGQGRNAGWVITIVTLSGLLAGCDDDPGLTGSCGDTGTSIENDVGRYCAYAVIETGFECPMDMPFHAPAGAGMLCSTAAIDSAALTDSLCASLEDLGLSCEDISATLDADGGVIAIGDSGTDDPPDTGVIIADSGPVTEDSGATDGGPSTACTITQSARTRWVLYTGPTHVETRMSAEDRFDDVTTMADSALLYARRQCAASPSGELLNCTGGQAGFFSYEATFSPTSGANTEQLTLTNVSPVWSQSATLNETFTLDAEGRFATMQSDEYYPEDTVPAQSVHNWTFAYSDDTSTVPSLITRTWDGATEGTDFTVTPDSDGRSFHADSSNPVNCATWTWMEPGGGTTQLFTINEWFDVVWLDDHRVVITAVGSYTGAEDIVYYGAIEYSGDCAFDLQQNVLRNFLNPWGIPYYIG